MTAEHTDPTAFLVRLETLHTPSVPVMDGTDAIACAHHLDSGTISARRMARALDTTFEDIDATFAHFDISYRIGL